MQEQQFIENLCKLKAAYHSPESAIDQANSCDTLSRDIYTDNQRFIYELLQNADDASSRQGVLDFRIDFADDYLVVSHKKRLVSKESVSNLYSLILTMLQSKVRTTVLSSTRILGLIIGMNRGGVIIIGNKCAKRKRKLPK